MAQTMKTACPSEENDKPGRAAASAGRPCLMPDHGTFGT